MNIERKYKMITIPNGKQKLNIEFADSYYDLLSTFFFVNYSYFGDWIDQKIAAVVSGKEENQNISGNICELVIRKDGIKVFDMLEVTTDEMIELMKEWHAKKNQL